MTLSKNTIYAIFAVVVMFSACNIGDENPSSTYGSGIFITCEGAFPGTGTVSFYNRTDSVLTDIYATENGASKIGSTFQSMTQYRGLAYLAVNGANRVIIADAKTFKVQSSLDTGLAFPNNIIGVDTALYISEWGKNGVNGAIKHYSLATKSLVKTTLTGVGSDDMIYANFRLWVVNGGGFGQDSTVAVVNTVRDSVERKVEVGLAPNSIVQDVNGDIWVLSGGYFNRAGNGKLVRIRENNVINTFDVPKYASSLTLDATKSTLYFIANNKIYVKDLLNFGVTPPSVFLTNEAFKGLYSIAVEPKTNNLYIGDAKDFKVTGEIFIYDLNTKSLKKVLSKGVGIAPNGFIFN